MRDADVLDHAERFVTAHSASDEQRRLLLRVFQQPRARLGRWRDPIGYLDCAQAPALVYAAVTGDDQPALPLAAAATLLWLGVGLLDDVMDGELPPEWDGERPTSVLLAALTLISALTPRALMAINAPSHILTSLQTRLADGLTAMSAGQLADLTAATLAAASPAGAEQSAARKSGAALAMVCAMAADLAGATAGTIAAYQRMGDALGRARQLQDDCRDLFFEPYSRDLDRGALTLPVTLALADATGTQQQELAAALAAAHGNRAGQHRARALLRRHGAFRASAILIELYAAEAEQALTDAGPRLPAAIELRRRMAHTSILGNEASSAGRLPPWRPMT